MRLTLDYLHDSITANPDKASQLYLKAHTLLLELAAHQGKRIRISNSFLAKNEKYYTLQEFNLFEIMDGSDNDTLSLIITGKEEDGQAIRSYAFNYISTINSDLTCAGVKYYLTLRNIHDSSENRSDTCRFLLLDK